ncbi:hypothetical protein GSI_11396 [Ganoderma sinense ZZ0214-1]|uniref:Transporter n=1 Tax=Ganoderma sinense ZZ0214-1 TaxID=1077348 RepID=A0A2G8RVX0_9APHY|nr:hypothetical protein GSI_11396 [Ganoderma sinense ZZ0214-1]
MARPFSLRYGIPRESFIFALLSLLSICLAFPIPPPKPRVPRVYPSTRLPCVLCSVANNGDLHSRVNPRRLRMAREAGPSFCYFSDEPIGPFCPIPTGFSGRFRLEDVEILARQSTVFLMSR